MSQKPPEQQNVIVITLTHPENLHFLRQVFDTYTKAGIPSELLPLAADTYLSLVHAKEFPLQTNLGKGKITDIGPGGIAMEFDPQKDEARIENMAI